MWLGATFQASGEVTSHLSFLRPSWLEHCNCILKKLWAWDKLGVCHHIDHSEHSHFTQVSFHIWWPAVQVCSGHPTVVSISQLLPEQIFINSCLCGYICRVCPMFMPRRDFRKHQINSFVCKERHWLDYLICWIHRLRAPDSHFLPLGSALAVLHGQSQWRLLSWSCAWLATKPFRTQLPYNPIIIALSFPSEFSILFITVYIFIDLNFSAWLNGLYCRPQIMVTTEVL